MPGFGRADLVGELVQALGALVEFYADRDCGFSSIEERALHDRAAAVHERARREAPRP